MTESEDDIREAFRVFDPEKTGKVSAAELRHVLMSVGEKLTGEELDEVIRECGVEDGKITMENFTRIMMGR